MALTLTATRYLKPLIGGLDFLSPLVDLTLRLWLANIFWKAGLTKIQTWDSTVWLFANEYQVPLLPPEAAALLGTSVELSMPVLLALGLATRFGAGVLFLFNIVAVVSYPSLNEIGLKDHIYWGLLLLVPLFHGPGAVSIDYLIRRRLWPAATASGRSSQVAGGYRAEG